MRLREVARPVSGLWASVDVRPGEDEEAGEGQGWGGGPQLAENSEVNNEQIDLISIQF